MSMKNINLDSETINSQSKTKEEFKSENEEKTKKDEKRTERQMLYEGKIHKCPNCGETIKGFEIKCSACGYELREIEVNNAVKELAQKLEKAKTIEEKEDLISNFYIPNTKEEIYDFFILASSNIQYNEYGMNAWYSKLEQAYHKAKITSNNSHEFQYIEKLYQTIKRKRLMYSIMNNLRKSRLLQGLLIGVIGSILMMFGEFKGEATGDPNSSYYTLELLGWMILACGFILIIVGLTSNKEKDDENEEEKK